MMRKLLLGIIVAVLPITVMAGAPGWYAGGQVLYVDYDNDLGGDDSNAGGKLNAGYRFGDGGSGLDNLALEASYQYMGDAKVGQTNEKKDLDGYTLDALGFLAFSKRVDGFIKAGYYDMDAQDGLNLGAGVASQIGRFTIRGEVTWFDADDADFWSAGLGAVWNFGG
jgi:hypothetical protein